MSMSISPNLTSHEGLVSGMADHHARPCNVTLPANTPNASNSWQPCRVPSHEALVAYIAEQHANLGNSSQLVNVTRDNNGTLADADPRGARDSRATILGFVGISIMLIGIIITFFTYTSIGRNAYFWKRKTPSQADIELATQGRTGRTGAN